MSKTAERKLKKIEDIIGRLNNFLNKELELATKYSTGKHAILYGRGSNEFRENYIKISLIEEIKKILKTNE